VSHDAFFRLAPNGHVVQWSYPVDAFEKAKHSGYYYQPTFDDPVDFPMILNLIKRFWPLALVVQMLCPPGPHLTHAWIWL